MRTSTFVLWAPRILGVAVALFIGLFALDAFGPGKSLGRALLDFAVHLVPALLLLAIVGASWRRPWIGGFAFVGFALYYAARVSRMDWILVISGPLLVVGLLFLWTWWRQTTASLSGPR